MTINLKDSQNRIPFSRRLFSTVLLMFLIFVSCFVFFQWTRESEYSKNKLNAVLSSYNYQLHQQTKKLLIERNISHVDSIAKFFITTVPQQDLRITIVNPQGGVLFDNSEATTFDNHNNRAEVLKARATGEGFSIRTSATTNIKYFYSARSIDGYVYRSALPYNPSLHEELLAETDFIYAAIILFMFFIFILSRFTRSIGQTIKELRLFAVNLEERRVTTTHDTFPDDELGDIAKHIVMMYQQQEKVKRELSFQQEKFYKHIQHSQAGFAIFNATGGEVISNIRFIEFVNLIADIPINHTEDAIEINELDDIREFLERNIAGNIANRKTAMRHSITIDKNGYTFRVETILFLDNTYELSIHDITRQEEEGRMKRQLTQNVAHELKTPVSTIQGYLETILNTPNLDADRKQFFLERCFSQSSRLADLLRDISVLYRIEEAGKLFDLTPINITKLTKEIELECTKQIQEKNITTQTSLFNEKDIIIEGNYSLLYSIFRNLYDNAIAYAGKGAKISLSCYKEDKEFFYFSFSDNGTGIEESHINRIFERFYRVDKGRSRKLGGTGLGLSIVKNAVQFHNGNISAKSSPGKGVTFLFTLKKKRRT